MNSKPFFVVLVFILLIVVFAGGSMANTDLTPNTPYVPSSSGGVDYSVFGDSSSADGLPVSGAVSSRCGTTYTVVRGDTLSRIAQNCGITLQQILAVNPSITNPNVIRVGQKITVVRTKATAKPTAAPKAKPSPTAVRGLRPGGELSVDLSGFPAKADVQISIGKVGAKKATSVQNSKTDAKGMLHARILIPKTAKAKETWQVTVTTVKKPKITVKANPFVIEK